MARLYIEWKKLSLKEKVETICLIIGVIIAGVALREYKTTNMLTRAAQFQSVERELCTMQMAKKHLGAIWVVIPDDIRGKKRADLMIDTILNVSSHDKSISKHDWKNVEDLEMLLYQPSSFSDEDLQNLRDAYLYMESILYLVFDVFIAKEQGLVSPAIFNTYSAYLKDLGGHPLFLHAVWFGYQSGYFNSDFAKFLKSELQNKVEIKEIIETIYPEMLLPDWSNKVGK